MRSCFGPYLSLSQCHLVSLSIVFFILGWLSSRNILSPIVAYIDYAVPPSPSCPDDDTHPISIDNDYAEHLFAGSSSDDDSPPKMSPTSPSNLASVKLLCMVLTSPNTTQSNAVEGVNATWGRRCDKLVFISSQRNDSVPTIPCNCTEGHDFLWGKIKAGFTYVHKNFNKEDSAEYDWFLKAGDDTFVVVENLKARLKRQDASQKVVLGQRASKLKEGLAGGPGYVLSKAALKLLVETGFQVGPNSDSDKAGCRKDEKGVEDVEMDKCLSALDVSFVDIRETGDDNVEAIIPNDSLTIMDNYWTIEDGPNCCSDRPVSFQRLNGTMIQTLEYLLYRFKIASKLET